MNLSTVLLYILCTRARDYRALLNKTAERETLLLLSCAARIKQAAARGSSSAAHLTAHPGLENPSTPDTSTQGAAGPRPGSRRKSRRRDAATGAATARHRASTAAGHRGQGHLLRDLLREGAGGPRRG
jgi:hypothetical protein